MTEQIPSDLGSGNELEFQFHFASLDGQTSEAVDQAALSRALLEYRKQQFDLHGIAYHGKGIQDDPYFDSTGGTTYMDEQLLEKTTPECRFIEDVATRIKGYEGFAIGIAKILAKRYGRTVDIHLRTADSEGGLSGTHDNHSTTKPPRGHFGKMVYRGMRGHLVTRGIVSGAGLVTSEGMYFAQKMAHPSALLHPTSGQPEGLFNIKGDKHSRYFPAYEQLVELRCGDHNLNPTAVRRRLGMGKIALLLALSPLNQQLQEFGDTHLEPIPQNVSKFNRIPLDGNGRLVFDPSVDLGAELQILESNLFLENLDLYTAGLHRDELVKIARGNRDFCSRFRDVLRGEADLDVLARESDWAAKTLLIRRHLERDQRHDLERSLYDDRAQAEDRRYDLISVSLEKQFETGGDEFKIVFGSGYRLRDGKNKSAEVVNQAEAEARIVPSDTRAVLRAFLLKSTKMVTCMWNVALLNDGAEGVVVAFPTSRSTEFSPEDKLKLAAIGIRV